MDKQENTVYDTICGSETHLCILPRSPMSCSVSTEHENATFFGLQPLNFGSKYGFADVLYAITDNQRLYRGDYLRYTSDFIDMQTSMVEVDLCVFGPEAGVLALLSITADMRRAEGFEVNYQLDFVNILEGEKLQEYIIYEIITMVLSSIIIVPAFFKLIRRFQFYLQRRRLKVAADNGLPHHIAVVWPQVGGGDDVDPKENSIAPLMDLCILVIPICVAWRMDVAFHSRKETQRIIETWANIDWANNLAHISSKKATFYTGVKELRDDMEGAATQMRVIFVALVVCMLQVVKLKVSSYIILVDHVSHDAYCSLSRFYVLLIVKLEPEYMFA